METEVAHFRYQGEPVDLVGPKNDQITRYFRQGVFYEAALLEEIRDLGVEGIYVDCGAHVGNHTVYFAKFCKATDVYAIECNEKLIPFLARNVKGLENVSVIHTCVGDGHPVRFEPGPELNIGMGRTVPGGTLRTYTLAELWPDGVALVKLDLEEAEPRVLRASRDWLQKHRPVVVAEAVDPAEIDAILDWPRRGPYAKTPTWIWRAP